MKLLTKRLLGTMIIGALLSSASAIFAQAPEKMPAPYNSLPWVYGKKDEDKKVKICNILDVKLPEGYALLHKPGTQQLNTMTENPQTNECATIAPSSLNWFAMFEYDPIGYVKDDEKIDPDELMKQMKEGNKIANEERAKRGWAPLEMVGWVKEPSYDKSVNRLAWAVRLKSEGQQTDNYETRVLGREGVTEVILVAAPEDMDAAIAELNQMLAKNIEYADGKRYDEFKDGDRLAKYGLAALITGGAVAVAAQSGLLKAVVKFIWIPIAAAGAFIGNLFRRKKKGAEDINDQDKV